MKRERKDRAAEELTVKVRLSETFVALRRELVGFLAMLGDAEDEDMACAPLFLEAVESARGIVAKTANIVRAGLFKPEEEEEEEEEEEDE